MSLAGEIRASAKAIRAARPGIGAAELRDRLRGVYVYRSPWARLDHNAAVWTDRAGGYLAAYLLALLVIAPASAVWGAAFGPRRVTIEQWIDAAIDDQGDSGRAEPPAAPDRGGRK